MGAALAYQDGKLTLHDRDEQAKTNSYSTALYVRNHIPLISNASHLNWLTGISLGHHRLDYKRNLVALDHQRLSSNAKTNSYQLFTELGWLLPMNDQWSVEPFVGAAWLHSRFGAMSEDGGYAALGYGANTLNTGYTQLGIRNAYGWDLANGQKGAVYLDLAWQHSFGKQQPHSSLQFASNQSVSFTTHGASLNKNSMQFGFGASVAVNTMSDVSLAYQGVLAGSSRRQHGGMLTIQHRF